MPYYTILAKGYVYFLEIDNFNCTVKTQRLLQQDYSSKQNLLYEALNI